MKRHVLRCMLIGLMLTLLLDPEAVSPAHASPVSDPNTPPAGGWRSGGPFDGDGNPVLVTAIAASPQYAQDGTLFAAGSGRDFGSVYRTTDRGHSWTEVLYPEPPDPYSGGWFRQVAVAASASGTATTVFASYNGNLSPDARAKAALLAPYGDLYRSTDQGQTWAIVLGRMFVGAFALSPTFASDHTLFAVTNSGLERSTDGGLTWQQVSYPTSAQSLNVYYLALSPDYANDHTLYAAGIGNIHRSTDAGVTWQPLPGLNPTYGLAISPNFASDGTFWSTYRTVEPVGDDTPESGVLRHTNRGASWQLATGGLPGTFDPNPRPLAVSPRFTVDGSLFTALSGPVSGLSHHSLFRTTNGGDTWIDLGPAPSDPDVYGLAATRTDDEGLTAHLATERGVWHYGGLCEERLVNGGFESNAAWVFPDTPRPAGYSTAQVYRGQRSLRAGIVTGADAYSYSSARQTVTIPAGVERAVLSLWWYPISNEGAGAPAAPSPALLQALAEERLPTGALVNDAQYILLLDEQNQIVRTLLWTRSNARAWQPLSFDLSTYAGRTLRLHLGVLNNGDGRTTALFADEASLVICWPRLGSERVYLPMMR